MRNLRRFFQSDFQRIKLGFQGKKPGNVIDAAENFFEDGEMKKKLTRAANHWI